MYLRLTCFLLILFSLDLMYVSLRTAKLGASFENKRWDGRNMSPNHANSTHPCSLSFFYTPICLSVCASVCMRVHTHTHTLVYNVSPEWAIPEALSHCVRTGKGTAFPSWDIDPRSAHYLYHPGYWSYTEWPAQSQDLGCHPCHFASVSEACSLGQCRPIPESVSLLVFCWGLVPGFNVSWLL